MLQRVKANAATGPDDIPAYVIRNIAQFIAPSITSLFNSSLATGCYPSEWKKANVTAVYKRKGSKSDAANYRPISILSILGRVLEKAVCAQLQLFCDTNSIIPKQQFGFRKHSSCELALVAATDSWMKEVSSGKFVGALLIDISKAFDSISHAQLTQELSNIGCSASAINWFSSFLAGRCQRVKMGPLLAPWVPVQKGVPQGSPLSPLLFNIMVRHLPDVSEAEAFQFADDLTNAVADRDLSSLATKVIDTYSKVKEFCAHRDLAINLEKNTTYNLQAGNEKSPRRFPNHP